MSYHSKILALELLRVFIASAATAPVRADVIQSALIRAVIRPVDVSNNIISLFRAGDWPFIRVTILQPKVW